MKGRREYKSHEGIYSQKKRREDALRHTREKRDRRQSARRSAQLETLPDASKSIKDTLESLMQQQLSLSDNKGDLEWDRDRMGLMQALWMTEYPTDLASSWLVMARPEGQRCLVEALKGRTISRLRNGTRLHDFESSLPGGRSPASGPTVLDCIYHEDNHTYYIMDLMCWNGVSIIDCEAVFRLNWLQTKLEECMTDTDTFTVDKDPFRFASVAFFECNEQGLLASLYDFVPFIRDGICILHKEGHYVQGSNELSLIWKDLTCSRYLIETDIYGMPLEYQCIALQLKDDMGLYTADRPPIRVADLDSCLMEEVKHPEKLPTRLLKFLILEDGVNGSFHLKFTGCVKNRRKSADLFSKIAFQRAAREGKIRSSDLISAVKNSH